jgi:hypothetical protein
MHLMSGTYVMVESHPNPLIAKFKLIFLLLRVSFNYRQAFLKNLEIYYRGDFDNLIKAMNMADHGIFKAAH